MKTSKTREIWSNAPSPIGRVRREGGREGEREREREREREKGREGRRGRERARNHTGS